MLLSDTPGSRASGLSFTSSCHLFTRSFSCARQALHAHFICLLWHRCRGPRHIEIVGPEGIRNLLRCILHVCRTSRTEGLEYTFDGLGFGM